MKNNKCIKCSSADIAYTQGTISMYSTNNGIKYVKITRYVCCGCGYIEEYLNKDEINKVKKYIKKKN